MTYATRLQRAVLAATLLLPSATALHAQQANPSAASFGMSNNYTAAARGYETIGWNPALLALNTQPRFSVGGLIFGSTAGTGPITINDLADYSGATIPRTVRQGWVNAVRSGGPQEGGIDGGATFVALSYGKFAAQVSASGSAAMNLNADALEMIFLGNADAVATNRTLRPSGNLAGSGFITTAFSYSRALAWKPTGKKGESLTVGATGKWVLGMAHVRAQDNGSALSKDTLKLRFPVISSTGADAGSGVGMDVGVAWHAANTTLGLTVMNLFNTFAWDAGGFECTDISADVDANRTLTNTDTAPCTGALKSTVDAAANLAFKPAVRAGLAWTGKKDWLVTADVQSQFGSESDAILIGPKMNIGVGAEYSGYKYVPLRSGLSVVTGGTQLAAGAGLRYKGYEANIGVQLRMVDGVNSTNLMFGLFSLR